MKKLEGLLDFLLALGKAGGLLELGFGGLELEDLLAGGELHEHDAEGPNVGGGRQAAGLGVGDFEEGLGRLEGEGLPLHVRLLQLEGVAEVQHAQLAHVVLARRLVHQQPDVVVLDVAVHHPQLPLQAVDEPQQLPNDLPQLVKRKPHP